MNKIKENWFKLGLLIVSIVVILFYLLLWRPAQTINEMLANNIKCQQEGMELSNKTEKELPEGQIYLEPQFRFARELNTCLFTGSWIWISKPARYTFIKDVYTNDIIGSYLIMNGEEDSLVGDKAHFENLQKKYFPE